MTNLEIAAEATRTPHVLTFTGSGREYFGIWIVNLLLSIVTLGIYSAWAKVRRTQYFARNTLLDGASFDYHGAPLAILKGRLIAVGLLLIYQFAGRLHPYLGLAAGAVLVVVLPRLLLKSLQFRLHNLSYRGLRFRFTGTMKEAYRAFLAWPFAALFSAYLLAPLSHQRIKRFQHDNSAYGQTYFSFHAPVRSFYTLYLKALGLILLCVALVAAGLLFTFYSAKVNALSTRTSVTLLGLIPVVAILLGIFVVKPFFAAWLQNLVWNHTRLGAHRFASRASALTLFGIQITNLLGIMVTLGLYRPFAVARLYRYQAQTISLLAAGPLDDFIAGNTAEVGAAGDETAEMFDIDIAF